MTIALTGAGSLFVRIGHIVGPAQDLLALMGGAATTNITSGFQFPGRFSTINADYVAGTPLPKTMAKSQDAPYTNLASWQGQQSSLFNWAASLIRDTLGAMVNLDQGLPEDDAIQPAAALAYLLNQMYGGSLSAPTATLQQSTVSIGAQTNVNTPVGNPVFVLSSKNVQGQVLQLIFPETITFTAATDSQRGAAPGNESIRYAGFPAINSPFSQLYPGGSGCSGSLSLVDGSKSNATGNLLVNGDFTQFNGSNANYPDNWVVVTGTAGTQILNGTSTHAYSPTVAGVAGGSLAWVGDSATLTKITQSFNTPVSTLNGVGGTPAILVPDNQHAFNFWGIIPAGIPTAGVLRVSLQDGAGNILNDDFGTANSTSFDLHALSVGNAFFNFNGTFRTPANLTTQTTPFKIVVELTTALTTGFTLYTSRTADALMTSLYTGGPSIVGFSGKNRVLAGLMPDQWTVAITNTMGKLQQWMDRVFGMRAVGLQCPYASSPSVADTLIV